MLMLAPLAKAHEFWLVPHDAQTGLEQKVVFELRVGPTWPGVQTPRIENLVNWFKAKDAQGEWNVAGRDHTFAVGNFTTRVPGATLVGMRTNSAHLELSATEFNQYLNEEGLNEVIKTRERFGLSDAPGRENFSRCAKSIVLVDGQSQGYDERIGLPLELIPQTDPLALDIGKPFVIQLLFLGEPLPNTLIKAQLKADPVVELTATSDSQGQVEFALPSAGLWLFNAVHMEPSSEDDSDWESLWASMTVQLSKNPSE
ncbi:DUF4198 domain-containing protein [Pseudomonas sp. RL_15y_Pfl2_60]|uniref:DUF4198 domain-containing protein n=1 Tax=Pseudomonas sp. RL_15y_Pfl2_60 TaxID=3088709 RepID=UPI0030D7AAFD